MWHRVKKVKCINNDNWKDYLTVGKVYDVRDDGNDPYMPERRYLLAADDLGNSYHYHKDYFEEL